MVFEAVESSCWGCLVVKENYVDGDTVNKDSLNEFGEAINDVVADDAGDDAAIAAKYTLPGGGIPSSDLAAAVQTSLGKADTALQSYTPADGSIAKAKLVSGVQTSLDKADSSLQLLEATLNAQTGTTYTFVASDNGKVVTHNNASPSTITVPQNSAAAIPVGAYIEVIQLGAGQVTIVQGTGATLNSRGGALKINAQYGVAGLRKVGTNAFILTGDLVV